MSRLYFIHTTFIYCILFIVWDISWKKCVFVGRKSLWTVKPHFMDSENYFGFQFSKHSIECVIKCVTFEMKKSFHCNDNVTDRKIFLRNLRWNSNQRNWLKNYNAAKVWMFTSLIARIREKVEHIHWICWCQIKMEIGHSSMTTWHQNSMLESEKSQQENKMRWM